MTARRTGTLANAGAEGTRVIDLATFTESMLTVAKQYRDPHLSKAVSSVAKLYHAGFKIDAIELGVGCWRYALVTYTRSKFVRDACARAERALACGIVKSAASQK